MPGDTADRPTAHVVFPLDVDADGWPPVSSERLWAHDLGGDRFRIDNAPWFVRDLAVGDVVVARAPQPGQDPVFERLESRSEHVTVRVVCFRSGPLEGRLDAVVEAFTPWGVWAEGVAQFGMVALDIPPGAPFRTVVERLRAGAADGSWEYDEGRITNDWEAASAERAQPPTKVSRTWFRRRR